MGLTVSGLSRNQKRSSVINKLSNVIADIKERDTNFNYCDNNVEVLSPMIMFSEDSFVKKNIAEKSFDSKN